MDIDALLCVCILCVCMYLHACVCVCRTRTRVHSHLLTCARTYIEYVSVAESCSSLLAFRCSLIVNPKVPCYGCAGFLVCIALTNT